ncbi:MAG: hypothetical protein AABZ47_02730 [Planctomycetota bacterium]
MTFKKTRRATGLHIATVLFLILPALTMAFQSDDVVEVQATGEGLSEDAARKDALRKALEKGGGIEISSHSKVENFELIRDTIYARADGIVTDYKLLEEGEGAGGTRICKIMAKVSKRAIATTWGEVQNVLDQIGRPAIVVCILEKIDGKLQDSSILQSKVEERLLKAGFDIRAGEQIKAIMEKESADAAVEDNTAKVQALAKDFGAQIFITGTASADAAGVRELAGEPVAMYNGDGMIRMFYTDTAQLLASESLANWRGGARGYRERSPQAGKKALENAGEELVERCYQTVMKNWATRISAGGELTLEIEGMTIADGIKIKKKLREIDPDRIVSVDGPSATKGIMTFRIKAKMTAETLAEYLVDGDWATIMDIKDLKSNRIQAKWIGK